MIGLVLVTHGRLADELRSAMEHVVGTQRNVATVCIGPDDDIEGRRAEIQRCIDTVDTGDGVVLLTDMFGGTPSNLAISQMDRRNVEVIAGVNLPMLVKLAKVRSNQPLADAVDCAQMAGRKYIAAASHVLPNTRRSEVPARCLNGVSVAPMTGPPVVAGGAAVTVAPAVPAAKEGGG
ncbi:PTS sugar transporter subunit IIA [Rhodovastum atsumiense]|uniref:PTS sugar transporter subunit IIA n=1 Tax=Rhodovastum atsumiense TaxID=504468 RepID=A0A5M6IPZ5_9PROT|nr:PTS sugar transporter subunit IIA [Rhodovastum atsumiense]CAH2600905.1 PTS sugar transporter subunit IIA [Rhodovastum atsumiense]